MTKKIIISSNHLSKFIKIINIVLITIVITIIIKILLNNIMLNDLFNSLDKLILMIGGYKFQKSKQIKIILKPILIYNITEETSTHLTGIKNIDQIINHKLVTNYLGIDNLLDHAKKYNLKIRKTDYYYIMNNYLFENDLIYMIAQKSNNDFFDKYDLKAIIDSIENYNDNIDAFMEGSLIIYEGNDLLETGRKFIDKPDVELGIKLVDIFPIS